MPLDFALWNHWAARVPREEVATVGAILIGGSVVTGLLFAAVAKKPAYRAYLWSPCGIWMLFTSMIHIGIELQFTLCRDKFFAHGVDLYAAGDLRYGRPLEAGTAAMELITAVVTGPLCLLTIFGEVRRARWRHVTAMAAATCQLYGLMWFTLHPLFSTVPAVTEDTFLFWLFVVGFNAPWGIAPPLVFYRSARQVLEAVGARDAATEKKDK